ncbi:40S ribosomal protein S20-like [Melanaphis sacchari]|uniref:40S ribosomal protein S20-like n=1 Tax=Melanaphis sacchari TaxID=742174 RepID=UPI000DC13590|nr:40S ribosomal protein S20-like [Melanaphis sacchari]
MTPTIRDIHVKTHYIMKLVNENLLVFSIFNIKKVYQVLILKDFKEDNDGILQSSPRVDLEFLDVKNIQTYQKNHKIRITLSSINIKSLKSACSAMIANIKQRKLPVKRPKRKTKILRIITRKTSCGGGFKTWDRFKIKILKRVIDLKCSSDDVKQIINVNLEPDVIVEVSIISE